MSDTSSGGTYCDGGEHIYPIAFIQLVNSVLLVMVGLYLTTGSGHTAAITQGATIMLLLSVVHVAVVVSEDDDE